MRRRSLKVGGVVQGVGFRPFVARQAIERGLVGWVRNDRDGATIEVQGVTSNLDSFEQALSKVEPPALITSVERQLLPLEKDVTFVIRKSDADAAPGAALAADLVTCAECLSEIFDSSGRRRGYAFTNCTRCGPRYTLVRRLPYDRVNTSMARFVLCHDCRREYEDLADRRYHAEPIACPACGPSLDLLDPTGQRLTDPDDAIAAACDLIAKGGIVAALGLGGFQFIVDAANDEAVQRLRTRKRRPHKPFAVMFPSADSLRESCRVLKEELDLLTCPAGPIVLLERREEPEETQTPRIATSVAPASRWLGAFLATTPLHHLLLARLDRPVVCTSGNFVDEPICTSSSDALGRLSALADAFLTHDRDVVRPVDDSVARVTSSGTEILRRARGYAGTAVAKLDTRVPIVGLGAQLKASVTLAVQGECVMSQHLGDLGDVRSEELLRATLEDLLSFFDLRPSWVACDRHPDYASTRIAEATAEQHGARLLRVQHHHAHVASVMAVNGLAGKVAGLVWDGSGYGDDGSLWGGELLTVDETGYERLAHLTAFPLQGGDLAARQPWRAALGLLTSLHEDTERIGVAPQVLNGARQALDAGVNVWSCTSVGRLFDAVAHLIFAGQPGLPGEVAVSCSFEGQAAMLLEAMAARAEPCGSYEIVLVERGGYIEGELGSLLGALLGDLSSGVKTPVMARRFHQALIDYGVRCATLAGLERVVLAGGCFQNLLLREGLTEALRRRGFTVFSAGPVPCNDGGISLGQVWVAANHGG